VQSHRVLLAVILFTALLQATSNTMMKVGRDQLVINAVLAGAAMVMASFLLPFTLPPSTASWPYIAGSTACQTAFFIFRGESYRFGDVSRVVPLTRGTALVFIAIAAAIYAGEPVGLRQGAGLGAILLGVLSLVFLGSDGVLDGWESVLHAVASGGMVAGFTIFDGLGVRQSNAQLGYVTWLYFVSGIPIIVLAIAWRGRGFVRALKQNWIYGSVSGVTATLAYSAVLWAIRTNAFAPIVALREASLVFTTLGGAVLLREAFGRRRTVAACLIFGGILALNF
jgi:drug/metabolite transporter (DMT)-like permease